jgi:uncharacterized membrane protein YbhN (UPF0104 family)
VITEPSNLRRWLVRVVKLLVLAVVAVFIVRWVNNALAELAKEKFSLADVHPWWILVSAVFFILSQVPLAWFWYAAMRQLGQRPTLLQALRAYMIGGLGKYVPGKAMVVVLRSALVRGPQVDTTVATLCVFIETLTMMAVGGFLSAVIMLAGFVDVDGGPLLHWVAVGLMLATGIPTLPPIFRRVVRVLRVSKAKSDIDMLLQRLDYQLMARGWIANFIAWPLMGLSLWATLRAMPGTDTALGGIVETLPLMTAAIALSTIAGFVSMIPGGFLVREMVLNVLLVPTFGKLAILSAILLRLVWLVSELLFSSILYLVGTGSLPVPESRTTTSSAKANPD